MAVSQWIRLCALNELRYSDLQGENLMTHLRDVPAKELAALQFADAATFRRAARFAAEHKIRAEAPGRSTLIVRMSDKGLFEDRGFKFRESKIADPEHVSSKTLSRLRLVGNKM
jgi:hypothetical protein